MSAIDIGGGVRLEDADGIRLETVGRRARRGASIGEPLLDGSIDAALRDAGYTIVADAELAPAPSLDEASGRRARGAQADPPSLAVPVMPGQSAVVLVESAGGVFTWRAPNESGGRRARGGGVLTFALRGPSVVAGPGRRSFGLGWIGDRLLAPIRVRVLTFFAGVAIDRLVDHFESDLKEGLVAIDGDPAGWTAHRAPTLPVAPGKRVLLLVHGTFSTTLGSYAALAATEPGRAFLDRAHRDYDAVLGFDHKTLAVDPLANARAIADALAVLPAGTRVDAIAYSRGALVYRTLRETVKPANLDFGTVVFVGAANAGTMLANPENWQALVDLYTSIAVAAVRAIGMATAFPAATIVAQAIKTIGRFVQALPDLAIGGERVPGLAAMEPDGTFVGTLNGDAADIGDYRVIASDFQPRFEPGRGLTAELIEFIVNRVGDRLLAQANDLVVHTASMTDFGKGGRSAPANTVKIAAEGLVYHLVYFASDAVVAALEHWLPGTGIAPAAAARRSSPEPPPVPVIEAAPVVVPADGAADDWFESVDASFRRAGGARRSCRRRNGPAAAPDRAIRGRHRGWRHRRRPRRWPAGSPRTWTRLPPRSPRCR